MGFKKIIKKILPKTVVQLYHLELAFLGALIYGFPGKSKKIKIIGITGTSGKSTVVDLVTKILEESGAKVASLSSVRFKIGDKEVENKLKMTMPGRLKIQRFLNDAIKEKCQYVVVEVTSEGIRQFRHKFINFDCSVFTNLSPEHIESHGGFEKYRNEKLKLFKATKNIHIINGDDKNKEYFLNIFSKKKIIFSLEKNINYYQKENQEFLFCENIEKTSNGSTFEVGGTKFEINIPGIFNVYNSLSAIAVGLAYSVSLETAKSALIKVSGIPGRMEFIAKEPFPVIVDYAHTPEALESVYKTLTGKNLICVLGSCGGGRDKWKRPVLGKIAKQYCSKVIVTNEDPYDEDPNKIMDEVVRGTDNTAEKVEDRKKAIQKAINGAKSGDAVIITGKGCEPWMCVKDGKKIPWSDAQIAKEAVSGKIDSK